MFRGTTAWLKNKLFWLIMLCIIFGLAIPGGPHLIGQGLVAIWNTLAGVFGPLLNALFGHHGVNVH
jgi:hypothetical protein